MPWLDWKMDRLYNGNEYWDCDQHLYKCDRCGKVENIKDVPYEETGEYVHHELWDSMIRLHGVQRCTVVPLEYDVEHRCSQYPTFCRPCAIAVTPLIGRMIDIAACNLEISRLQRAISEKRRQDNRGPENAFGKRLQSGRAGANGNRQGAGPAQAG